MEERYLKARRQEAEARLVSGGAEKEASRVT